jgi:Leucine-rich repeat (LRR) protein
MLNLSRNILTDISSETLSQLKRLHMLDLSFNSISFLEAGCFISSTKLQSIYLQA